MQLIKAIFGIKVFLNLSPVNKAVLQICNNVLITKYLDHLDYTDHLTQT